MTIPTRALFVLALVAATLVPTPLAAASDCVEVNTTTFSEGFRVIANAGRSLALGFRSGDPGDGVGFVVIITPAVCSGLGVGTLDVSSLTAPGRVADVQAFSDQVPIEQVPSYLPLP